MAKVTTIEFVLTNVNGVLEKLSSNTTPRQKKGGDFLWTIENRLLDDVQINLVNFNPKGMVNIASKLPTTAPAGGVALVLASVPVHEVQLETKVTYDLTVNKKKLDPDLIIDGDGGGPDPHKKGGKKKAKRKGGKKR
jgi:hypothetical protein